MACLFIRISFTSSKRTFQKAQRIKCISKKRFTRKALLPCAALILGASALQATTVKSEKFEIPFEFKVQKLQTLPAGEYEVQQAGGSDFAILVNRKTGQRVQFLRPPNTHEEGKARLIFENNENGYSLKRIS
jgi:hypothetical protein